MKYFIQMALLVLSFSAFGQRSRYFVELVPTASYGYVRNSLHYNHADARFKGGISAGLGFLKPLKRHSNWLWVLTATLDKRQFELNRLQPYSNDPVSVTPLLRTTHGAEVWLGLVRQMPISVSSNVLLTGGVTQQVVGKQYQDAFLSSGAVRRSETFGVGSVTLRNRAFLRGGVEFRVAQSLALHLEGSFSAEIKAPFVKTVDKVNPLTLGIHLRVVWLR